MKGKRIYPLPKPKEAPLPPKEKGVILSPKPGGKPLIRKLRRRVVLPPKPVLKRGK